MTLMNKDNKGLSPTPNLTGLSGYILLKGPLGGSF